MNAMPSLNGSVGYIFTSCNLDVKNSGNVRFKDMIERFKVYDQPRRPEGRTEEWLAGERVDSRGMPSECWSFDTVSITLTGRL
jgi:mitochondrial distribution and morphology protein 10